MSALLARSQPHATEVISGLILECRDGKGNRKRNALSSRSCGGSTWRG
jgi:hypothetical protein